MNNRALIFPTVQILDWVNDPIPIQPSIVRYPTSWSLKTLKLYVAEHMGLKDSQFDLVPYEHVAHYELPHTHERN